MSEHTPSQPVSHAAPVDHSAVQIFALPDLLPASVRLLIESQANVVILLPRCLDEAELTMHPRSFQLTPSSMRVFLLLVQTYPQICSYQALFQSLYPYAPEQATHESGKQELAVRPVWRAIVKLAPLLRSLNLQLRSLRGQGYVLSPRKTPI